MNRRTFHNLKSRRAQDHLAKRKKKKDQERRRQRQQGKDPYKTWGF